LASFGVYSGKLALLLDAFAAGPGGQKAVTHRFALARVPRGAIHWHRRQV
jgi:hypothetical protein